MDVLLSNPVRALRTERLSRPRDGRFLVVPMDHSLADGALCSAARFRDLVEEVSQAGADAVVLHKGRLRQVPSRCFLDCAVIIHLNGSTPHSPDPDRKTIVGGVEESLAAGADAISVHINIGSNSESQQIADLGAVARECERHAIPLLAMMYARGPAVTSSADPVLIRHAATVATDLGADLVKVSIPAPAEELAVLATESPIPLLVAGGSPQGASDPSELAHFVIDSGAAGLAVGRRVFESPAPGDVVARLRAIIHPKTKEYL